jgi:hypothetical protein
VTYGLRLIPFRGSGAGFLRNMRLELNALSVQFKDADEQRSLPIPLFPVVYWQW